jgi:hypothetical protein
MYCGTLLYRRQHRYGMAIVLMRLRKLLIVVSYKFKEAFQGAGAHAGVATIPRTLLQGRRVCQIERLTVDKMLVMITLHCSMQHRLPRRHVYANVYATNTAHVVSRLIQQPCSLVSF